MSASRAVDLTTGSIKKILLKLTLPMIFGMLGMVIFNLIDTYFIGQLGKIQLAAISFTFPVVLVVQSISLGVGMGTGSVISRIAGKGDTTGLKRLATDSLILAILVVIVSMIIGVFTIEPLFSALGADGTVMPYIKGYMSIWYFGLPFVVVPMVGNNIIRSLGDTMVPGLVMIGSSVLNAVLDPLLIFGISIFPKMGIQGAALATVIARAVTFVAALLILIKREKILTLKKVAFQKVLASWKKILYVGIPAAGARVLLPVGAGIITALLAQQGYAAVAGYGAATKIEFFLMSVLNALASIMIPFAGQNYGAKKLKRITEGLKTASVFSFLYTAAIFIIIFFSAPYISALFSKDQEVIGIMVSYMRIVTGGYAFYGVLQCVNSSFNAVNKPVFSTILALVQMFAVYIPLAVWFQTLWGSAGIFIALVISYVLTAVASYILFERLIKKKAAALLDA